MQRSKQQAVMFLLGAVLVGGFMGFTVDRVSHTDRKTWASRTRFYEDLGLSEAQRVRMDSLLDDRNCQISAVMKPVRAHLDSIKQAAHQQMIQLMTPEQQQKLELRRNEMERRDNIEKARRDSIAAKTQNTCRG
jgi:hypothetical protein